MNTKRLQDTIKTALDNMIEQMSKTRDRNSLPGKINVYLSDHNDTMNHIALEHAAKRRMYLVEDAPPMSPITVTDSIVHGIPVGISDFHDEWNGYALDYVRERKATGLQGQK